MRAAHCEGVGSKYVALAIGGVSFIWKESSKGYGVWITLAGCHSFGENLQYPGEDRRNIGIPVLIYFALCSLPVY